MKKIDQSKAYNLFNPMNCYCVIDDDSIMILVYVISYVNKYVGNDHLSFRISWKIKRLNRYFINIRGHLWKRSVPAWY